MAEQRCRRVLLVTRNMPPLVGGMERLNWHMAYRLAETSEVRIVAPQGAAGMAPGLSVREVPLAPLGKFLSLAAIATLREAMAWRPDVVLAGSGLTAPLALVAARASAAKAVAYVHGLDVAVRNPVYRGIWLPALRKMNRVIANSSATAALCARIGIEVSRTGIVHPGVEVQPPPSATEIESFRARHSLGNRPLLLSVGRLTSRKGLLEFVQGAMPKIAAARPDVLLLVVGEAPTQALHASVQTPDAIQRAAQELGLAGNLQFLGVETDYRKLGLIYHAAQVHVFPVRELLGDPEGFGMVAVESAAHGLPTVAFSTGGVVDAVSDNVSGRLIASGDYDGLADAVLDILRHPDEWSGGCRGFAAQFAWQQFGAKVAAQLESAAGTARSGVQE